MYGIRMVCAKKNFPFPICSMERLVSFHFRPLVIRYPFKICSYSFQSPFEVGVHFLSVSNPFYIRSMFTVSFCTWQLNDFYSLLNSAHAGQLFTCGRKKGSDSLTTPIQMLSARVTCFAQSLCTY